MKIGSAFIINGETVRKNEQYTLTDSTHLSRLTVSRTYLKPNQSTNGHSHQGKEEVYIFTQGRGKIQIGQDAEPTHAIVGDVFIIPDGEFHKVFASLTGLTFISIFEKYEGR